MKASDNDITAGQHKKSINDSLPKRLFPLTATEYTGLYINYYGFLQNVIEKKGTAASEDETIRICFDELHKSTQNGMDNIIKAIEHLTSRKIVVYISEKSECLLRIARDYGADIPEIVELNRITNLFSLENNKPVLIPLKF